MEESIQAEENQNPSSTDDPCRRREGGPGLTALSPAGEGALPPPDS